MVSVSVAAASRIFADVPQSPAWPDPPPMSTLHALLLFGGVPLAISVGIALLVLAPSLASGPRYRPAERWDAGAEIFRTDQDGAVTIDTDGTSIDVHTFTGRRFQLPHRQ